MAAKRNKFRNSSINVRVDKFQLLNLPPQIIHLLRRSKKRTPLHHVSITWWVPPATRCNRNRTRFPEFRRLGISSNTSSASTRRQHFYGDFVIHNAAKDFRQVMVYSWTENTWVGYDLDPLDPFDSKKKCVELNMGKQKQGNLAIEDIDSRVKLTGIHINRGAVSVNWRVFREHLLEMDGELFLFFLIHKKSIEVVDHVEVFRLCFDELMKWVKIEGMKGKTVFLGRDCCWVDSGEIGCRGDCVYFTQGQDDCWWVYDMQSCYISVAPIDNGSDILLLHFSCTNRQRFRYFVTRSSFKNYN